MKRRPLPLLALLAIAARAAIAQVDVAWVQSPAGSNPSRDAADNVFTARSDVNPAGDIVLAKRSPAGVLLWEARHDNTDPTRHEIASWVATAADGSTYVAGTIRSGFSNPVNVNALLMKFDAAGRLLWRRVLGTPFDGSSAMRVILGEAGHAYVVGLGTGPNGQVATVRKLDAAGQEVWAWFDGAGIGAPVQAKWTPDGHLLVVGRSLTGQLNGFARIDAQGTAVWTLAGVTSATVGDAAGDAFGHTVVINGAASGSLLARYSPSGSLVWQRTAPLAGSRVEVAPDGAAIVSGFPNTGTAGAAMAAFSAAGDLRWSNLDADGPALATLLHAQLLVDAAGDAYLAGSNLFQMAVVKVRGSDGAGAWTALAGSGSALGIALGSVGQVYVAGGSVARLDPTGTPPPPPTIDLAVQLADAPDPVRVGGRLTYTAALRNLGNATAPDVRLRLTLPPRVRWIGASPSQGACARDGSVVDCTLGALAAGGEASVAVTVEPRQRGTLSATATVSTPAADAVPANDSAVTTTTVGR